MVPPRCRAVLLIAALLVLVVAAPASARLPDSAYFKSRAWFKATIAGTYVAHGTATEQCSRQGGEDQFQPFTGPRTVDASLQFKSVRSVRLEADRYLDNSIQAGTMNRRTPVVATETRTLTASAQCDPQRPEPTC